MEQVGSENQQEVVCVIAYVHSLLGEYIICMYPVRFVLTLYNGKNICVFVCMFVIGLCFTVHTSVDMWRENLPY